MYWVLVPLLIYILNTLSSSTSELRSVIILPNFETVHRVYTCTIYHEITFRSFSKNVWFRLLTY